MTAQKVFDLEARTLDFSKKILTFARRLNPNLVNRELISQLIRSSSSIGANYREANDALGKKDFALRIRICRREAKETFYWLELLLHENPNLKENINKLLSEAMEFVKIFSSIITKVL